MYCMEITWNDGTGATCFTESKHQSYNWFFENACRENVNSCKVFRVTADGRHLSILRYKNHDEE